MKADDQALIRLVDIENNKIPKHCKKKVRMHSH